MPANLHSFDEDSLPAAVVVDSSFVFEAVVDPNAGDGRHEKSAAFAQRLREHGTILVYSDLVFLEAPQCWRRLRRRDALTVEDGSGTEEVRWARTFETLSEQVALFLAQFDIWKVALSPDVLALVNIHTSGYDLKSHDAVTVALTTTTGIRDVVSLDNDFQTVEHIRLWTLQN